MDPRKKRYEREVPSRPPKSWKNGASGTTAHVLRLCTERLFANLELILRPGKRIDPVSIKKGVVGSFRARIASKGARSFVFELVWKSTGKQLATGTVQYTTRYAHWIAVANIVVCIHALV